MFEDKIEAMNKLPNAVDDSSGFEKRVYTVEEIMDILSIGKNTECSRQLRRFPFCKGRRTLQNFQEEL